MKMILRLINHEHIDRTIRRNFIMGIVATFLVFIGGFMYYWVNPPRINLNDPAQNRAGYHPGQRVRIDANIVDGEECLADLKNGNEFTIYVFPELTVSPDNGLDYLSGFTGIKTDSNAEGAFNVYVGEVSQQKETVMVHVDGYLKELDPPHGIIAEHTWEDKIEIYLPMCVTSDPMDNTVSFTILIAGLALGLYSSVSLFFAFRTADKAKRS